MITYTKTETLLSIKDVTLKYGTRTILNRVNANVLDIERDDLSTQGQVVCFLGPSGIGKSQLARCIAGLQSPTSGSITIGPNCIPTKAGAVGFVQQSYPLFPYLTAMQNLRVAAKFGKSESKIAGYWDRLGLPKSLFGSYPKQLSGGQRQRVAIIRQLLCSGAEGSHLLILDEPFSGLDIKAKQAACQLISDVAAMDTLNTILVITHDVTEGMSIADLVWLMGKIDGEEGATILNEYDLASMGLAWQPDISMNREFIELVGLVKHQFLGIA